MRILVVNPNTTAAMTAKIGQAARRCAAPGTEIVAMTSVHGPVSIEGYFDEAMSLAGLLQGAIDQVLISGDLRCRQDQ